MRLNNISLTQNKLTPNHNKNLIYYQLNQIIYLTTKQQKFVTNSQLCVRNKKRSTVILQFHVKFA